jgi:hypothetical protein
MKQILITTLLLVRMGVFTCYAHLDEEEKAI